MSGTLLLVRVQARGGKFLADDIGGAEVIVRDDHSGDMLGSAVVQGDSGTLSSTYQAAASRNTMIVPASPVNPQPIVQWLVADAGSSGHLFNLSLQRPTLLRISVLGPVGGLQSAQRVTTHLWAVPGVNNNLPPVPVGMVIELPGLLVNVMQPAVHEPLPPNPNTRNVDFKVKVMMMCGCQIAEPTAPPNPWPWIFSDFDVKVVFTPLSGGAGPLPDLILGYDGGTTSTFSGSRSVTGRGFYQAAITAVQKSTGNTGTATVTFYVTT